MSVSSEHARKWITASEEVIVVLWDLATERGWYAYPRAQFELHSPALQNNESVTIQFENSALFDAGAVHKISWRCRMQNLYGQYLAARDRSQWADAYTEETGKFFVRPHRDRGFIVLSLLGMLGYITPGQQILASEAERIKSTCRSIVERGVSLDDAFDQAVVLSLAEYARQKTATAVPLSLMEEMISYVELILLCGASSPTDWLSIHGTETTPEECPF